MSSVHTSSAADFVGKGSSIEKPSLRDSALDDFLRRVNLFKSALDTLTTSAWTVVAFLAVAFLAILSDAAFAWPAFVRVAIDLVAVGAIFIVVVLLTLRLWRRRYDARRLARLVEQRLDRHDSLLVNAVEFRESMGSGSPLLRARVVRMADEFAQQTSSTQVVETRSATRASLVAVAAFLTCLGASFFAPKLFGMVIPRFLDPLGNHPAYTLLNFAVTISPEPVFHSRPATITVDISGPDRVEKADVIFVDLNGMPDVSLGSIAAFRADEGRFVAEIARVEQSGRFYVDTARGRSPIFDLSVTETPFFEETTARLDFPAYTNWKPAEQKLDRRGLRGLVGTTATVRIRSNLPLQSGVVTLFPASKTQDAPDRIPLAPLANDPHIVEGKFPIAFNGRFEIAITAASGGSSLEPLSGPITAIPDRAPQVAITTPDSSLVAMEGWKVPVVIEASDDVRIARTRIFRGVNGWSPVPVEVPRESSAPHLARSRYEFDLDSLGARTGDVISYYASVDDNFPGDPHSADTPIQTIQVISAEEYKDFARQQYQMDEFVEEFNSFREQLEQLGQEREKAVEQLEQLRSKAEAGPLSTEDQEQAKQLEEQLRKFSEETNQLRKNLDERTKQLELYEMEKEYTEELKTLSKQLENQEKNANDVAEQLSQMRQSSPSTESQREEFQKAAEKFQKENEPFNPESREQSQSAADDLELMQLADAMMAQTERLKAVIAQQRDLANRLAELAGKQQLSSDEQQRADRFAKEQELLEQELKSLQKDLMEAATKAEPRLPQMAESVRQLSEKIDESQIAQDQQAAAQNARTGNGDEAHRLGESAARKLEALQSLAGECQQCKGLKEGLDGPLNMSKERLSKTLKQLSQGRKVPGLGQRSGKKQGQGGQQGEGQSEGQGDGTSSAGPWDSNQSFPGSQSDMQVMGPRTRQMVESQDRNATMQSDGRGRLVSPTATDPDAGHEVINPETRDFSGSSAGNLRGVPVGYRDAAEAYFRRLAEESKAK